MALLIDPPMTVVSIARIQREAQQAAERYTDINDACPYPFGSDAAHAFKAHFFAALDAKAQPTQTAQEAPND